MEEWGLERLQGLRSVDWRPDARSVGVGKSKPSVASLVCLGVQPQLAPLHPPAPSCPRALSTSPVPPQGRFLSLSPSFANWIHFSFCSHPSFYSSSLPKPAPIPSSGKAQFWFPYKSWLWSVEVTWSHYYSSMRTTRGDSDWNCDSLGCPRRCQWSEIVTLLLLLNINDEPSVRQILYSNLKQRLNRYVSHTATYPQQNVLFLFGKLHLLLMVVNKHLLSFISCDPVMIAVWKLY